MSNNRQYDLFTNFLSNEDKDQHLSNTFDFWDCIPKYFFTPSFAKKLRTTDGLAEPYKRTFSFNRINHTVVIQPALIKQYNGKYLAFFPGFTEELIEDVLIKLLSNQNNGTHNPYKKETSVNFSLQKIKRELKNSGKERNIKQIKHVIKVMSLTALTLYEEDQEIWTGTLLQDLNPVTRCEYLEKSKKLHSARLPLPITDAICTAEYRQFNFSVLMTLQSQLSRWLFKRLVNRYKQASLFDEYNCLYSSLKRDSALLEQATDRDNRKKLLFALNELIKRHIIMPFSTQEVKNGVKIVDVKYIMTATSNFTSEQKAANKRAKKSL